MKYRLFMGFILIAGLVSVGCDANRGKGVATNTDNSNAVAGGGGTSSGGGAANALAKYDNFVVEYPEKFDGEFNPDGLDVGPEEGQLAPEIEGADLEGTEFKLSDYRGKVVMLDFYGDW